MKKKVWLLLPATLSLLMANALPKGEEYLSPENYVAQQGAPQEKDEKPEVTPNDL